nr:unnamed protein product [Digitaria exilis]
MEQVSVAYSQIDEESLVCRRRSPWRAAAAAPGAPPLPLVAWCAFGLRWTAGVAGWRHGAACSVRLTSSARTTAQHGSAWAAWPSGGWRLRPPNIKSFIDGVTTIPLENVELPLKDFAWEFDKQHLSCLLASTDADIVEASLQTLMASVNKSVGKSSIRISTEVGSTLHFEFYRGSDKSEKSQSPDSENRLEVIHVPNVNTCKETDLEVLDKLVKDYSVPQALRRCKDFGGGVFSLAANVMSDLIHKDPTCYAVLDAAGLPQAFLDAIMDGVLYNSDAIIFESSQWGHNRGLINEESDSHKECDNSSAAVPMDTDLEGATAQSEGVPSEVGCSGKMVETALDAMASSSIELFLPECICNVAHAEILKELGKVYIEVTWQISLLSDAKVDKQESDQDDVPLDASVSNASERDSDDDTNLKQSRNSVGVANQRVTSPTLDESAIATIVEMGFSRARAEEALRSVRTNSLEMATDWLFSHPEEFVQEDVQLAQALALSLGSSVETLKEDGSNKNDTANSDEKGVFVLPLDDILTVSTKLFCSSDSTMAFSLTDLLVTLCNRNKGDYRERVVLYLFEQLRSFSTDTVVDTGALDSVAHLLALLLSEDSGIGEIGAENGVIPHVLIMLENLKSRTDQPDQTEDFKSRTDQTDRTWNAISALLLILDNMLQFNPNLNTEATDGASKSTSDAFSADSKANPAPTDEKKIETMDSADDTSANVFEKILGRSTGYLTDLESQKALVFCCEFIKKHVPSTVMQAVLQLSARLTKTHALAAQFFESGGLSALLNLPSACIFPGFETLASAIVRHLIEDPQTLQSAMELEIRQSLSNRGSRTPRSFLTNMAPLISRDPVIFMRAVTSVCQLDSSGGRMGVVLLKEKDREKQKLQTETSVPCNEPVQVAADIKSVDKPNRYSRSHKKVPASLSQVIDQLLEIIVSYPSATKEQGFDGYSLLTPMDVDEPNTKGKSKVDDGQELEGDARSERSTLLAKLAFVLKLMSEILLIQSNLPVLGCSPDIAKPMVDGGMVQSLSGLLKVIDLDHPDAAKVVNLILKALDSLTRTAYASDQVLKSDRHNKNILPGSHEQTQEADDNVIHEQNTDNGIHHTDDIIQATNQQPQELSQVDGDHNESHGQPAEQEMGVDLVETNSIGSPPVIGVEFMREETINVMPASADVGLAFPMQHQADDEMGEEDEDIGEEGEDEDEDEDDVEIADEGAGLMSIGDTDIEDQENNVIGDEYNDDLMDEEDDDFFENRVIEVRWRESLTGMDHHLRFSRGHADSSGFVDISSDSFHGVGTDDSFNLHRSFGLERRRQSGSRSLLDRPRSDGNAFLHPLLVRPAQAREGTGSAWPSGGTLSTDFHTLSFGNSDIPFYMLDAGFPPESAPSLFGERVVSTAPPPLIDFSLRMDSLRMRRGPGDNPWTDDSQPQAGNHAAAIAQAIEDQFMSHLTVASNSNNAPQLQPEQAGNDGNAQLPSLDTENAEPIATDSPAQPAPENDGLCPTNDGLCPTNDDQPAHQQVHTVNQESAPENDGLCPTNVQVNLQLVDSVHDNCVEEAVQQTAAADRIPQSDEIMSIVDTQLGGCSDRDSLYGNQSYDHIMHNEISAPQQVQLSNDPRDAPSDLESSCHAFVTSSSVAPELSDAHVGSATVNADVDMNNVDIADNEVGDSACGSDGNDLSSRRHEEAHQEPQTEQQNANNEASSANEIDPTFLEALPEDLRAEVLASQQNRSIPAASYTPPAAEEIDPEFLAALPPDIQAEVLAQQHAQRVAHAQPVGQPVDMDNASIIATFPPDLREEVLLTSSEAVLSALPSALLAEAQMLRDRELSRYRARGSLFGGSYRLGGRRLPAVNQTVIDRAVGATVGRRVISATPGSSKGKDVQRTPLLDSDALHALIRLLQLVPVMSKLCAVSH